MAVTVTGRWSRPRWSRPPSGAPPTIARRLVISPKTARNHVEHIYAKIGVNGRVTASLFAMQHGLLPDAAEVAHHA